MLTAVFRASGPGLRGLLWSCGLRSAADIDDALQTTFLRAFAPAARNAYSGLSPYEAYLKTIARNVARDLQRSGRARFELLDPEAGRDQPASGTADPEVQAMAAERCELRDRFVSGLSPLEQQVYRLCLCEGLPERDAAADLGRTRHKVRSCLLGIRRKLLRFARESRIGE